jgi:hypothetical protein
VPHDSDARLRQSLAIAAALAAVCLGLGAACLVLSRRAGAASSGDAGSRFDDPEVRKAAIAELVERGAGGWDSFPDPDVGRVLQQNLKHRKIEGHPVASNLLGLREGPVAIPKPEGTTRIVLLGDSFVMGEGVDVGDRLGVFLEKGLRDHAAAGTGPIECLHFGLDTWNIVAETSYLRRQLALVRPDLVIHVIVRNDLEDNVGARGFGAMSSFDPRHPERGDGILQARFPSVAFGTKEQNWIAHGLDWESRTRFEEAGRRVADLARRVEQAGGRYLLFDYYTGLLPASRHFITSQLRPEQVAYLPSALIQDARYRVAPDNAHWNRAGHELVARMAASLIRSRDLLPKLGLAAWPEADAAAREWLEAGEREASAEPRFDQTPGRRKIRAELDFTRVDDESAAQVTGGIVRGGLAGPYVSLVLKGGGAHRLAITGRGLPRPELDGTRVTVFVEEARVGEFRVQPDRPIELSLPVPEPIAARPFVAVRFIADDYAYSRDDLRQHVVFALFHVALAGG